VRAARGITRVTGSEVRAEISDGANPCRELRLLFRETDGFAQASEVEHVNADHVAPSLLHGSSPIHACADLRDRGPLPTFFEAKMYKRFVFEGDIHDSLECVPLSVRRKLDLAALKISLEGWQSLSRPERLALCHLPVDTPEELDVYREVLRGACERGCVALKKLDDPDAEARTWNALHVPPGLAARLSDLDVTLGDADWVSLDEESRYALLKLAHPKRNPLKLHALLVELGRLPGPAPSIHAKVVVCEPNGG
jgi:hypothetical protein